MPLQATSGAASYDAFGGGVPVVPAYIEEVFSTYLYSGNGSTQTIDNGIDLATKGGLSWIKCRNSSTPVHIWVDSARGNTKAIYSNATSDQYSEAGLTTLTSSGFSVGQVSTSVLNVNATSQTYSSWSFAKAPKFFDVVTFTSNASGGATFSHNLGSVPGCVIVKSTANAEDWYVWHRGTTGGFGARALFLNLTMAEFNLGYTTTATSTDVTIPNVLGNPTAPYVAYLFAHDAGGFGLTGTDNVISCGSFTTSSYAATVNLGYEPQWLLVKSTSSSGNWFVIDNMRGLTNGSGANFLFPNLSDAELASGSNAVKLLSTGFSLDVGYSPWNGNATNTYIYIAIRRGPMKVPTSGTSVFAPVARTGTSASANVTAGFAPDLLITDPRATGDRPRWWDRLRGANLQITSNNTNAENTATDAVNAFNNTTLTLGADVNNLVNQSGSTYINWMFGRAPSFFDEVCYTGTGSARTVTHNLTVAPELMIFKQRDIGGWWMVYPVQLGNKYLVLQRTDAVANGFTGLWNNTAPTSSVFSLGTGSDVNQSGGTYVAYLFATCAGVSKVGSYTGNGSTQTINCGFGAGGARLVLIKRTDSTGDWYVYDTARGMTVLTDPYLLLNQTVAETATLGSVTTVSTGFAVNASILAAINTNAASYIFLAIA